MAEDGLITVAYDASSLGAIANFSHFQSALEPQMNDAMQQIGTLLVDTAVANTWTAFANPTGYLASQIAYVLSGPMEVIITVDVPYAWRMEEGFHGADSLGRVYNEEGKPYAMPALASNEDQIVMLLGNAAALAFAQIGGA